MGGGELYQTYNRKSFHGSEKHAKFYVAGTTFAFEHMHERRIIYRDLKPENLLSGHPPFEAAYPMQVYSKVMQGINKVNFPPKCQGPASELIKGLLRANPSERLPMRPGGTKNLKECKWYQQTQPFDWKAMFELT